jgi:hypothetical protein
MVCFSHLILMLPIMVVPPHGSCVAVGDHSQDMVASFALARPDVEFRSRVVQKPVVPTLDDWPNPPCNSCGGHGWVVWDGSGGGIAAP